MTPTQEINERLAALRRAIGGKLDPDSQEFDADANGVMNWLEMHARSHANQLETREEYITRIEAKASQVDNLTARLVALEGDPAIRSERLAVLKSHQEAITAEMVKLEALGQSLADGRRG